MKPSELILRCYVEPDDGAWFAMCIDLNLYARADSIGEAKQKLNEFIGEYVKEAFTEDSEYLENLIPRPAPLAFQAHYRWLLFKMKFHHIVAQPFVEYLPLKPA